MTDLTPDKLDQIEKAASARHASIGDHWLSEEGFAGDGWGERAARYLATMDPTTTLALVARVRELEAQVGRVRELHKRNGDSVPWCGECEEWNTGGIDWKSWPCDTIKALGEEA